MRLLITPRNYSDQLIRKFKSTSLKLWGLMMLAKMTIQMTIPKN